MSLETGNTNELYALLQTDLRHELAQHERLLTAPGGATLINHSVLPDHLVILNSGTVRVSVPCSRRAVSMTTGEPGKVFGMRAAISGELPEVDVTCVGPCNITILPLDVFLNLLKNHPEIYFAVAKVLSADLQIADRILRDHPRRAPVPRFKVPKSV
ncbi:MAG TPA: Crp/Fnr family transcriptional regulator [Candidatus Sulfotelmatobacter sp.]|nr:Crp/Fnr family transcriptional regulator [Candidatus Sulfotelmatobacter sp.]